MSQTKAQLLGPLVADDIAINGGLNLDNGTLKVDPATNRVGINNANPTKTLDVGGDVNLTDLYYTTEYPTIRPSLDLAFAQTKELDSRITFTRSTTATFVGTDGLIKTAAVNTPRFDHDPTTGESLGLLIEEPRTNLITLSNNFTEGTYWTDIGNRWSSSLHSDIAPDGSTSVWKITRTSGDALLRRSGVSVSSGTTYTFSAYFKSISGGTAINMDISDLNGGTQPIYTDRWTRISFTVVAPSSSIYLDIGLQDAVGNDEYLIWGAQLEAGSFATSYIPTSGSSVTRSGDAASFNGTNLTSWYNQREGTWIIDTYKDRGITGGYAALFYMRPTNTGIGTRNEIYKGSGNSRFTFQYGINNYTTVANINPADGISAGNNKIFAYYKENDFGLGFNGSIKGTDTSGGVQQQTDPSIFLVLGSTLDSEFWNGHFRRFTFYPRRLNNTQIQNITL